MTRTDVSVVIPTFNRAGLLERAILSVVCQTTLPREIIVVDDGSTDETRDLVLALHKKYPELIRYLYQNNHGPAAARNRGIDCAQYDYIAFLDSDDHWHKRKLERQYFQMVANKNYIISHTREKWLRNGAHLNQKKIHIPQHGYIFDHCLQLCAVGMSTVMAKKQLFTSIGYFDNSLPCCEDYDLWLRTSMIYDFLLIDYPLTIKEGGREDQVSVQHRMGMDRFRILSLENLLKNPGLKKAQRILASQMLVKKARIYGKGCWKHGRKEEGQRYLELADKYDKII